MPRWPYHTRAWRLTRATKLSTNPYCEVCGAIADQVDHIRPVAAGGFPFDWSNLQSLCQSCHSTKTTAEDGGFGNRRGRWRPKGCAADGTPLDPAHEWNQ